MAVYDTYWQQPLGPPKPGGGFSLTKMLGGLMGDPVWGGLFAELGTGLINRFLGIGDQMLPGEQLNQQYIQAAQAALPDIKRASAGLPTAGSRNIMRQVQREGTRMQQSMASSARAAGHLGAPAGTEPFRAQSERIGASQQEALANLLGQHQMQAQQQLMGGIGPAIGREAKMYQQGVSTERYVKGMLGKLGRHYADNPEDEQTNRLIDAIYKIALGGGAGGAAPAKPRSFKKSFSLDTSLPGFATGGG